MLLIDTSGFWLSEARCSILAAAIQGTVCTFPSHNKVPDWTPPDGWIDVHLCRVLNATADAQAGCCVTQHDRCGCLNSDPSAEATDFTFLASRTWQQSALAPESCTVFTSFFQAGFASFEFCGPGICRLLRLNNTAG